MLRLPSLQKEFAFVYSGDDALVQPPEDAAARADYDHKLTVARETGDYSALLLEGRQPSQFILRPIPGDALRRLFDGAGKLGNNTLASMSFRLAIVRVVDLAGVEVKHEVDKNLGRIATVGVVNALDSIDPAIVNEAGLHALVRSQGIPGKR